MDALEMMLSRERSALLPLLEMRMKAVMRLVAKTLQRREAPVDLAEDIVNRLHYDIPSLALRYDPAGRSTAWTWLCEVARNRATDTARAYRRRVKREAMILQPEWHFIQRVLADPNATLVRWRPKVYDGLLERLETESEREAKARRALTLLEAMPPRTKEIVWEVLALGHPQRAVADRVGLTQVRILKIVRRAVEDIRKAVGIRLDLPIYFPQRKGIGYPTNATYRYPALMDVESGTPKHARVPMLA